MRKKEFEVAIKRMADEAGMRKVADRMRAGTTWMGICSGVSVVMNLDSVRLCVDFCSPEQGTNSDDDPGDDESLDSTESEEDEPAFQRAAEKGIPESWFVQYEGDVWGFQLFIDQKRRKKLDSGALAGLLESIARDLNELGAEESQPCSECGKEATTLGYFASFSRGSQVIAYCPLCWEKVQEETQGAITVGQPTQIRNGWTFLFVSSLAFAGLWGCSQHPALKIPWVFLFLGCAAAGVAISVGTAWFAYGSNLSLRLGVALNVILATLVGNMIGIKFLHGAALSWPALVPFYFLTYFPAHVGQEILFFACGLIGVVIGFFVLRESERVRVR